MLYRAKLRHIPGVFCGKSPDAPLYHPWITTASSRSTVPHGAQWWEALRSFLPLGGIYDWLTRVLEIGATLAFTRFPRWSNPPWVDLSDWLVMLSITEGQEKNIAKPHALSQPSSEQSMKILRIKAVMEMTGLPRSTVYWYMKSGSFPKSIKLGVRSAGWLEEDLLEWIRCRKMEGG